MTKLISYDGVKSSLLWDEETDAWVYLSGKPEAKESPRSYYKVIPTLFRGVDLRASSVASLPWEIRKGDTVVDSSEDYQNYAGLVGNMTTMLYLIEASLVLAGRAYWKREKNPAGFDKLRHLDPGSLELDEGRAVNGELVWKRQANGKTVDMTTDEIIYLWYPDPYVEIGPPSSWPALAALNACGVLANLDEFARNYFGRGAIKAMLFSMEGASKQTAEEFEGWWARWVSGIKNAFRTKVLNAAKVNPVVIGEGIKELENVTLSSEKREEIALALSIPMSILFANAANYATAERDKLNWYEDKIVPESMMIAGILNDQVYSKMGLVFSFKPETLDIFQEDEAQRAAAMSAFMDAIDKAGSFDMAQALFDIFGVEMSEEAMGWIEAHFAGKAERAEAMTAQLGGGNAADDEPEPDEEEPEEDEEEAPPVRSVDLQQVQAEVSRWQAKVLKAVKRGEDPADIPWVPVAIPGEIDAKIRMGLLTATTEADVKHVFRMAFREDAETITPFVAELAEWESYVIGGKGLEVETVTIPPTLAASIVGALSAATAHEHIRAVFASARQWEGYP